MEKFTDGERFIIEWQLGTLGGFHTHLAEALSHADRRNRYLLGLGFPVEAQAMTQYQEQDGWFDLLRIRAAQEGIHV